jgi:hypothetical protein
MATINLSAARDKGQNPVIGAANATVERDGVNVYIAVPETQGVVSRDSATAFADALYAAAGSAPKAGAQVVTNLPAGLALMPQGNGFILTDAAGKVLHTFAPQTRYV